MDFIWLGVLMVHGLCAAQPDQLVSAWAAGSAGWNVAQSKRMPGSSGCDSFSERWGIPSH